MRVYSLDTIVSNVLLQKGYTQHWYVEFLNYAVNILRELTFDDLHIVNTVKLSTNSYGAISIPCDCVDVIGVGFLAGQRIRPLVPDGRINPLHNFDSGGNVVPYSTNDPSADLFFDISPYMFGSTGWSFYFDNFSVIRERSEVQLDENITSNTPVVLQYISDGGCIDSLSSVDPYARATIDAYIKWQHKENSRTYAISERQLAKNEYASQRKILRARKSPLTADVVRRIFNRSATSAPK